MTRLLFFMVFAVCLFSSSHGEILWYWDLTEEPSGWSHGAYWEFNTSGANLYYNSPWPAFRPSLTTSLLSDNLCLPSSVAGCGLQISFDHALTYVGAVYDQPMWTDIEARVILNSDTSYAYAYNDYIYAGVHSWDTLSTEDFGEITLILSSVEEGDTLSFEFYFHTLIYGVINSTFIDWIITDLTVETVNTALPIHTWGMIKHSF